MQPITLRRGLNLPIAGAPDQQISAGPKVSTVAVLGADYLGLKPRLSVDEGDIVGAGAPIFAHKDTPDAVVVTPVSGRIKAINRGLRRVLISVEIEVDADAAEPLDFSNVGDISLRDGLIERICAAGLWTSFRARPYSKVPDPTTRP
ncbi:MAG: NADH:ubiquinone reductase (Na(+)-transporting) subunit A, partial [Pseudomonadota bacterium]